LKGSKRLVFYSSKQKFSLEMMKRLFPQIFLLATISLTAWSCNPATPDISPSSSVTPQPNSAALPEGMHSAAPKPSATPKPIASTSPNITSTTPATAISDSKELGSDSIQDVSRRICQTAHPNSRWFSYAETRNFKIYLCADEKSPDRPRWYISKNTDGSDGLTLEANEPLEYGIVKFQNAGYTYEIIRPKNRVPFLRITFPNGLTKQEELLRNLNSQDLANDDTKNETMASRQERLVPLQAVLRDRERLGICSFNFAAENANQYSRAYELGQNRKLVIVMCYLAAYQGSYALALYDANTKEVRQLDLEVFIPQDDQFLKSKNSGFGGLYDFDPKTKLLTIFSKARGLSDCGTYSIHKFERDRFVLQEYRAKLDCDGNAIDPPKYPLIYPK
jgi:hypothetical protein